MGTRTSNPQSYLERRDRAELGRRIHRLRQTRDLTQGQVAAQAGTSLSNVQSYEYGRALPPAAIEGPLAAALGCRPEHLRPFDFPDEGMRAAALLQLSAFYGLAPQRASGELSLSPRNDLVKGLLADWAEMEAQARTCPARRAALLDWQAGWTSSFDPADFPARYSQGADGAWNLIEDWQARCLARKLEVERRVRGLSRPQMAKLVGSSESRYRGIEVGLQPPRRDKVRKFANALGVSEAALTFYDFGDPVQAGHSLMQLAPLIGLRPESVRNGKPALVPVSEEGLRAIARMMPR